MALRAIISCKRSKLYQTHKAINPIFQNFHTTTTSPLKNPALPSPFQCAWTIFSRFEFVGPIGSREVHDGRPRGSLWRGKKMLGKEALFVVMGLKRVKKDEEKLKNFMKTHVLRLLKMDLICVLNELERQQEVTLSIKVFEVMQKQDWYKPDRYLYKDLLIALTKKKRMKEAMKLWDSMKEENAFPDCQTYTAMIRGFLRDGSPGDAMNIYEDLKHLPDPPDEGPYRILLKGLIPHPLLRNKVKQDFEEIFPDQQMYDPPSEIFGLR